MSEPVAFAIKKPAVDMAGAYLLFVTRPPGAFGGGGTAMFVVDALERYQNGYQGKQGGAVVVAFPQTTEYLLVARDLTIPMTVEDLMTQQKEEQDRWAAVDNVAAAAEASQLDGVAAPEQLPLPAVGQYL